MPSDNKSGPKPPESIPSDPSKPDSASAADGAARRRAVRRILAGGGLIAGSQAMPGEWSKPVVDAVLLPAHAATSLEDPCLVTILKGDQSSSEIAVRLDGVVNPPTGGVEVTINLQTIGGSGDSAGPFTRTSASDGTYSVTPVTLGGGSGITAVRATVSIPGDSDECQAPVPAPSTSTQPPQTSTTSGGTTSTTGNGTSTTTSPRPNT